MWNMTLTSAAIIRSKCPWVAWLAAMLPLPQSLCFCGENHSIACLPFHFAFHIASHCVLIFWTRCVVKIIRKKSIRPCMASEMYCILSAPKPAHKYLTLTSIHIFLSNSCAIQFIIHNKLNFFINVLNQWPVYTFNTWIHLEYHYSLNIYDIMFPEISYWCCYAGFRMNISGLYLILRASDELFL